MSAGVARQAKAYEFGCQPAAGCVIAPRIAFFGRDPPLLSPSDLHHLREVKTPFIRSGFRRNRIANLDSPYRLAACAVVAVCMLAPLSVATAQGLVDTRSASDGTGDPSEVFLRAFTSVQQGEKLEGDNKLRPALAKYRFAASLLEQLTQTNPNWQPLIVRYRVRKTNEDIHKLEEKISADSGSAAAVAPPAQSGADDDLPVPDNVPAPGPARALSAQVAPAPERETIDRSTSDLRAKLADTQTQLKAALNALAGAQKDKQDAIRQKQDIEFQLRSAESGVKAAQKRFEHTRADRDDLQAQVDKTESRLKEALAKNPDATDTRKDLRDQLVRQKALLAKAKTDSDEAAKERDALNTKIKESEERNAALTKERDTAVARNELTQDAAKKIESLQVENDTLTKKLATAEQSITDLTNESLKKKEELDGMQKELVAARDQLAVSRDQKDRSDTAITELREQLDQNNKMLAEMKAKGQTSEDFDRLTKENTLFKDLVLRQLKDQARRDQAKKLVTDELERLAVQSSVLTEQVAELGRPSVQLTDEERALFKDPQLGLAETADPGAIVANITAIKPKTAGDAAAPGVEPAATAPDNGAPPPVAAASPAPGTAQAPRVETNFRPPVGEELKPLARQATEEFARGHYVEAESTYKKLLAREPMNPYLLSNQGVVLFRQGKLKSAEVVLKKSVAAAPNDAFTLATLGIVYYRMGRYDDAMTYLTQAITIDPKNATAHAYLGITSSQKGWPEAGLEELQKAVALNPNYADAHFNIAVIYATNQPPSKDRARESYKTAISLGASPDPNLEKLIDQQKGR